MRWLAANISMLFTELPFLDRLAAARDHGFTAVECLFPYAVEADRLARAAEAANVRFVLFNAAPGNWDAGERGLAALAGRARDFHDSIDLAARYARILGVDQIHVMAGNADRADPAAGGRYRDSLRHACDRFAAEGIYALIEPINPVDMPGYFLSDVDQAARLIGEVARDNLALQFDLYHCQRIHGAIWPRLAGYYPLIRHMQIAGTPLRHEPDIGDLPVGRILAFLDEQDYPGWIGCEYRPVESTAGGLGWIFGQPILGG